MGTACIPDTDSVHLDLSGAFSEATCHLLAQGCRRIAYMSRVVPENMPISSRVFVAPREAYAGEMAAAGLQTELIPLATASRESAPRGGRDPRAYTRPS